jgi:plasmid stabilization system protein ParE
MSYRVSFSAEALQNVLANRDWIAERSAEGAARWLHALEAAVSELERNPFDAPLAPENEHAAFELRNMFFQTRRGRRYRMVFYVEGDAVHATHVRGPGQQLLPPDEFPAP